MCLLLPLAVVNKCAVLLARRVPILSKKSKKYVVRLTEEERAHLRTLIVGGGSASARTLSRARILLKANEGEGGAGWSDAAIAEALEVGLSNRGAGEAALRQ